MELNALVSQATASPTLVLNQKANALKKAGKNIINLTTGEPDFPTPKSIQEAACRAIAEGKNFYCPSAGIPELREAVAQQTTREYGRTVKSADVFVSVGAKQALFSYFFSILEPKDEVIVLGPYWVSYGEMVRLCGGVAKLVSSSVEQHFEPKLETIASAITEKTRVIILNSPSNPTGQVYSSGFIKGIRELLAKHPRISVVTDDIYAKLIYDGNFESVAMGEELPWSQVAIVNGVSKTYSMTGWRLGWMVTHPTIVEGMTAVQSQLNSGPATVSQWAALAALQGGEVEAKSMQQSFRQRRDLVWEALRSMPGLNVIKPKGAFYFFPALDKDLLQGDVKSDDDFCIYLLEKHLLAVVPGSAFGAPGYFRLSFSTSTDVLNEGMLRLAKAMEELRVA